MGRLTALHYAILSRDLRKIKLLISHGSNVNALDVEGKTPIRMLFNKEDSAKTSRTNINTIWYYLIQQGAWVPSYDDLDSIEKNAISKDMSMYFDILSFFSAFFEQKKWH